MKYGRSLRTWIPVLAILGGACGAPDRGSSAGSGGGSGLGGTTASGGTVGAGGSSDVVASGGRAGSGGDSGMGGVPSGGGTTGQGGSAGGGTTDPGGKSGAGGKDASGGAIGSGGRTATTSGGGASGGAGPAGGASGGPAGGTVASGGRTGSGGTTTNGGAASGGVGPAGGASGGAAGVRGGDTAAGGTAGSGGGAAGSGPCDIYQSGNTPCVAAHSMVRALYAAYSGKLYQIRRASDKTTKDISVSGPGGFVDSSVQDSFCSGTTCTISYIYDQSPQKNDLPLSPPVHWLANGGTEAATGAGKGQAKVGGHTVYGVYVQADVGNTYRNNKAQGLAKNDEPESMYIVADGKHYNGRCCFDYGNVETDGNDDGNATMETIEFGNMTTWSGGSGAGPWILVDLENGVFAGGQTSGTVSVNTPIVANYVTLMVKGPSGNHMTLKAGDAQSGSLAVKYDGGRPPAYSPQHKQGAVELGTGGDGSAGGIGTFFEGAITTGGSSDAIDDAVQANIVAAGYGR